MNFKFNLQRFAYADDANDTKINATLSISPELVKVGWAKDTWESGLHRAFFDKFTGNSPENIIQIREELTKDDGDTINIPLLMPLTGDGVTGDDWLEGNEEAMIYRDFKVTINQLRHAVRLKGKMTEQRVSLDLRRDAKVALSNWLADKIDKTIFQELSTDPTPDRVVYGGAATSEAAIGTGDYFTLDLIGKAKRIALADENTMIKPIMIDGLETYIMILDQWQARDLKKDKDWLEAQQYANVRGNKNPIFSGALGVYDGVVLHQCNRIIRKENTAGIKVGHALFLGRQAAVFAVGNNPTWNEKTFDYDNKIGVEFGRIFGIKKTQFKYDGTNLTDFGCINVLTASEDDPS